MRFYKGKYLISVYDEEDNLLNVCNDVNDFAKYSGMDIRSSFVSVGKVFSKKQDTIKIGDKKCTLYFTPVTDYDVEEEE